MSARRNKTRVSSLLRGRFDGKFIGRSADDTHLRNAHKNFVSQPNPSPEEIASLASQVLGSSELAQAWLKRPASALDGKLPQDLLGDSAGTAKVRELLLRIEHGVYT